MNSLRSLLITTSYNKMNDAENKTGVWLEDLAAPYFILKDGGEFITIVSPKGGRIPLDPNSQTGTAITENTIRFNNDAQAMYHFSHSLPLNEVKPQDFDLLFVVGGYGTMWDFPENESMQQLLEDFIRAGKPVGLVGHAVVAMIELTLDNGEPLVKGRKITAFSNSEEATAGLAEKPPFSLEAKLFALGALYSQGIDFKSYVVADKNIITGQNPASSLETAKQVLAMAHQLKEQKKLETV